MDTTFKQLPAKPVSAKARFAHWALTIFTIALIIWSVIGINFSGIKATTRQVTGAIFSGFIHPDWSYIYNGTGEDLVSQLWETLCIVFLGTFISAIISIPFVFWAVTTKNKKWYASRLGKFVSTFIKCFPEIVLALMFIKAIGPGSAAGVLALGFHSVGMLAMLLSETAESLGGGPNEAAIASGGSRRNVAMFATLPSLMPTLISNASYRFDVSVRSASILGIIGTGNIGYPLTTALNCRQWSHVGIILIGTIVMVILIDWVSSTIRKKLV